MTPAQQFAALAIVWVVAYALIVAAWPRTKSSPAEYEAAGSAGVEAPETQPERVESSAPRPAVVGGDER